MSVVSVAAMSSGCCLFRVFTDTTVRMGSSTESARDVIANDLLTFIQNAVDFDDEERIRELCATTYSAEDIADAKSVLYTATGKMSDLDFIINVMKTSKEELPVFVTTDLRRLPLLTVNKTSQKCEPVQLSATLTGLPPEVLAIIVSKLDTKSLYNLYHTCPELKSIVRSPGAVKRCRFSLNSLATGRSLQSAFFRDVSPHLLSLNLSGVSDLDVTSLIETLKTMENLTDLDVSYSNVMMTDLLDIVKVKPSLNSIAINFTFSEPLGWSRDWEPLLEYQQALARFRRVQLVQPPQARFRALLALHLLQKATILNLSFLLGTVEINDLMSDNDVDWRAMTMPSVSHFQLFMMTKELRSLVVSPMFTLIDFDLYEVIVCTRISSRPPSPVKVLATPLLGDFIRDKFAADVDNLCDVRQQLTIAGENRSFLEVAFLLWDKELTTFDDAFYSNLLSTLKEYLEFSFDNSYSNAVPTAYRCYTYSYPLCRSQKLTLNFGQIFKHHQNVKLHIKSYSYLNVTLVLVNDYNFFNKLTHLCLSNTSKWGWLFLKNVFFHCNCLVTLEFTGWFELKQLEFLKESRSIKNIKLHDEFDNYLLSSNIFLYLSKCRTLENIHIHRRYSFLSLPEPTALFRNCPSLYHICIHPCDKGLAEEYYAASAALGRDIHIDINSSEVCMFTPHDAVFDLYRLKPLNWL